MFYVVDIIAHYPSSIHTIMVASIISDDKALYYIALSIIFESYKYMAILRKKTINKTRTAFAFSIVTAIALVYTFDGYFDKLMYMSVNLLFVVGLLTVSWIEKLRSTGSAIFTADIDYIADERLIISYDFLFPRKIRFKINVFIVGLCEIASLSIVANVVAGAHLRMHTPTSGPSDYIVVFMFILLALLCIFSTSFGVAFWRRYRESR